MRSAVGADASGEAVPSVDDVVDVSIDLVE